MGLNLPWSPGETHRSPVIAVVPVHQDDPGAPYSCAALRLLGGTPLIVLALRTLHNSGAVDRITVTCPADLEQPIAQVLKTLPVDLPVTGPLVTCCPDRLLTSDTPDCVGQLDCPIQSDRPDCQDLLHEPERLSAGAGRCPMNRLEQPWDTAAVLVVHDPLRAFVPAETVKTVVETLQQAPPGCLAAVPVGPVTDTVKRISRDSSVLSTEDRDRFRSVSSPVAYRIPGTGPFGEWAVLRSLLDAGSPPPPLPGRADRAPDPRWSDLRTGLIGTLDDLRPPQPPPGTHGSAELCGVAVSAQHEMRIASQDDLDLAEALLAVGRLH
ncbi:MAG: 2-C-methyl-D-erythritol 4-phosphate cytidylyltransferase [Actinomycetota bacterium]|nr:2-C-methyl-D-erythritol 4-phosphate cytidylyltransferase [Actinomycetota bacterium]